MRALAHIVGPSRFTTYDDTRASTAETATGITLTPNSDGTVTITVDAAVSAHAHWSSAAWLWWPQVDSILGRAIAGNAVPTTTRYLLEFVSLPDDASNIQIGIAWQDSNSRAANHCLGVADFSNASRIVGAARHLSGTTAQTLDNGGAGVFDAVLADPGINVGTSQLINGTTTVVGVQAADLDPGVTPWDIAQHGGNLESATYVGLGVRAVGSTAATSATVRVRAFVTNLDEVIG